MTRKAFILRKQRVVVFWAPKSGSSSIARALCEAFLPPHESEAADARRSPRWQLKQGGYQCTAQEAYDAVTAQGYRNAVMLREPYDRLVSVFAGKFVMRDQRPLLVERQLEGYALRFLDRYRRRHGAPGHSLTFREFATEVCNLILARGTEEPRLNFHFSTQVPFWFRDTGFEYGKVFDVRMAESFSSHLEQLTGQKLSVPRDNVARWPVAAAPSNDPSAVDLPAASIAAAEWLPSRSQFESPELRNLVRQAFDIDYRYLALAAK